MSTMGAAPTSGSVPGWRSLAGVGGGADSAGRGAGGASIGPDASALAGMVAISAVLLPDPGVRPRADRNGRGEEVRGARVSRSEVADCVRPGRTAAGLAAARGTGVAHAVALGCAVQVDVKKRANRPRSRSHACSPCMYVEGREWHILVVGWIPRLSADLRVR